MKPQPLPPLSEKQIRAFWSYVDKRGPDDCWLWTGGTTSRKYSCLRYGAFNYRANGVHKILRPHRIAWTLQVGPIPDDMTIDHVAGRCTSTLCMNARHMEPVTHEENVRRRVGDTTPHKYRKLRGVRPNNRRYASPASLARSRQPRGGVYGPSHPNPARPAMTLQRSHQ